jgi:hypothetical protein
MAARRAPGIFRPLMRPLPLLLLLTGCVNFHSYERRPSGWGATAPAAAAAPQWQTIGSSVQGRPLRTLRLGHGPRRVVWVGGIHGDEQEGRVATEGLPHEFLHQPGAAEAVTLTILEDVNPDGSDQRTRANGNGVDLNRNYPARNFIASAGNGQQPLDQPEARALHDFLLAERPHLVIVAHAWRGDHFINFDGPAERHAQLFSQRSGYRVKPSDKIAPTPGSLGSWVGRTLGTPILTLEYERGADPRTVWLDTRDAILAVILAE